MAILFLALLIGCLTADPLPAVREGCGIADFENCIERDSIRPFFEERVMVDEFPGLRLGSREARIIRRFFSDDDPFHELFRVIDS